MDFIGEDPRRDSRVVLRDRVDVVRWDGEDVQSTILERNQWWLRLSVALPPGVVRASTAAGNVRPVGTGSG